MTINKNAPFIQAYRDTELVLITEEQRLGLPVDLILEQNCFLMKTCLKLEKPAMFQLTL